MIFVRLLVLIIFNYPELIIWRWTW